jgi:predicted metal-binding protein
MKEKEDMLVERALELGLRVIHWKLIYDVENRTRLKCAYGCRGYGKR